MPSRFEFMPLALDDASARSLMLARFSGALVATRTLHYRAGEATFAAAHLPGSSRWRPRRRPAEAGLRMFNHPTYTSRSRHSPEMSAEWARPAETFHATGIAPHTRHTIGVAANPCCANYPSALRIPDSAGPAAFPHVTGRRLPDAWPAANADTGRARTSHMRRKEESNGRAANARLSPGRPLARRR